MGGTIATVRFDAVSRDTMGRGFYFARRVSWRPNSGWIPVMVRESLTNSSPELLVFEPGEKKPDPLSKWVFLSEIVGLDNLDDDGLPMAGPAYKADPVREPFWEAC